MKKLTLLSMQVLMLYCVNAQTAPGTIPGNLNSCTYSCISSMPLSCTQNTVTNFNDRQYVSGTGSGSKSVGAVWNFYNVATDNSIPNQPLQVNATIKVDAIYRAQIVDFDDNQAKDQNNVLLPNLFAPTISADQVLSSSDRTGYVQFTIKFYQNTVTGNSNKFIAANYTQPIALTNLNYVHYDIDGIHAYDFKLRETGVVKLLSTNNPVINVNNLTELNNYVYTGDGSNWKGFVGSICNRDNTSNCSQVVANMSFSGAQQSVTFRMGYDYNRLSGNGLNQQIGRLYGATFGCFNFPQQNALPIKLSDFTGSYFNNTALLTWKSASEINFDRFEIERSADATDFNTMGTRLARGNGSEKNSSYQFNDDLSFENGHIYYYRLKMIDKDGKFTYSNTVIIRKEQLEGRSLHIVPNPVSSGDVFSVRFFSPLNGIVNIRILDFSGKTVYTQQSKILKGTNNIPLRAPANIQPGMHLLQVIGDNLNTSAKFTFTK